MRLPIYIAIEPSDFRALYVSIISFYIISKKVYFKDICNFFKIKGLNFDVSSFFLISSIAMIISFFQLYIIERTL